jgi:DNA-binding CsgD family transcriptional regulator
MIHISYRCILKCHLYFLSVLFFAITGCQNNQDPISINEDKFDPKKAQQEFDSLTFSKQWDYILKIVSVHYKNQEAADKWLLQVCPELFSEKDQIDLSKLKLVNKNLYNANVSESAFAFAENTFKKFGFSKDYSVQGYAAAIMSNHYQSLKLYDSVKKYNEVLKNSLAFDNQELRLIYHTNEGNYLKDQGYLFESAVNYHKALELSNVNDSMNQFTLLNNLSGVYYDLNYPDKAKIFIDSAKSLIPSNKWTIESLNHAGLVFSKTKDYTLAKGYFLSAIDKSIIEKNSISLAQSYSNYANFNRKVKAFDEALKFMAKSDSICSVLELDFGMMINHVNRAELYLESKNFEKAIYELNLAKIDLPKFASPKLEIDYYELAYRINDAIGNNLEANALFRLYIEKKEAQFGDLPRSILAEWELATENEKNTKERAYFEVQHEQESKEKYIISFFSCLLLIVISFFFISRYRKQKIDKQRISFELELKSKQLVSESLKNITVENTKEELLIQLEEIVADLPKMHQVKFENIKNSLKFKKSMSMLTEFETRFNSVYEYFYSQLKALAPDLTPNELRICALMRLNITTKEIALLTNRSIGTIDNTRSSIRKKLKIDEEINLLDFLMNI